MHTTTHGGKAERFTIPLANQGGQSFEVDGGEPLPDGLGDVSCFPALIAELLRRGYSDDDVRKVAGGNVLRALRGAETTAARLQAERPPSEATIEAMDGAAETD